MKDLNEAVRRQAELRKSLFKELQHKACRPISDNEETVKYQELAEKMGLKDTPEGIEVSGAFIDSLILNYSILVAVCEGAENYLDYQAPHGDLTSREFMLKNALLNAVCEMNDMVYALIAGPKKKK